jgi:hypothetical protein
MRGLHRLHPRRQRSAWATTMELRDFIQRIIVPILIDRYLEGRKKDGERGVGQLQSPNRSPS